MVKWKNNVVHQFRKVKSATTNFITERRDPSEDAPDIEIDPRKYEVFMQLAERKNTSVNELIQRALAQYAEIESSEINRRIPDQQKDNNPLLKLDNMTKPKALESQKE